MPIPSGLSTITVTSSYPAIDGSPQTGSVLIETGQRIIDATGKVIFSGTATRPVFHGVMQPIVLPCTDNTDLNPTGYAYKITETLNGVAQTPYWVSLPSTLGATVDLSALAPVSDPPDVSAFATANTWTSPQTFDGNPPLEIPSGAVSGYVLTSDTDGNATWQPSTGGGGGGAVDSVFGRTGVVTAHTGDYTATQVGADASGAASAALASAEAYADTNKLSKAASLSDVASAATARTNLGLGTAATQASSAFDTAGAAATALTSAETYADTNKLAKASNLSDLASASTARTNLGLGTAATLASTAVAQVANNLSDLANATTARSNLGLGTAATQASTAFDASGAATTAQSNAETYADTNKLAKASNLSDLASATTARTNLGLGTAATQASTAFDASGAATAAQAAAQAASVPKAGGTMTGWLAPAVASLTFGATIAVNAALGNAYNLTLTASTGTLSNPTNPVDGQVIRVRVTQGTGGSFTLAYGTAYDFGAASAPTLSTAAGKVDILGFEYVASISKWCYVGSGLGF